MVRKKITIIEYSMIEFVQVNGVSRDTTVWKKVSSMSHSRG